MPASRRRVFDPMPTATQPSAPAKLMIATLGLSFTLTAIHSTLSTAPYDDQLTVQAAVQGHNVLNAGALHTLAPIKQRKTSRLTALARSLRAGITVAEWAAMPSTAGLDIDDVLNRS